ncbi:hypothetical protein niasHT_006613 [Heterodera trifolii]|uniref:Uncharacterized protein n=1 Tax=Heterodera trifolii TaxID=157864 RepID=A0ABD2MAY2_9BILA
MFNYLMSFFGLLVLLSGGKAQMQTKPVRLIDDNNALFSIPIAFMDQCLPHEELKTFGIEFRLPKKGGKCDEGGMLICYPSTLSNRSINILHSVDEFSVNSELYTVDNKNKFVKECEGMLFGKADEKRKHWNGFRVFTEQRNGQRLIKLATSHPGSEHEQSYELHDAVRQFVIHFGNAQELFTFVTINFGERIELDPSDKEKHDAYKKLAKRGAPLKDFAGFWMMGLDILPWTEQDLKLNVIRSCNCTMEAWFVRPSDSELVEPDEPTFGSALAKECKHRTKKDISIAGNLSAHHLIFVQLIPREEMPFVNFILRGNANKSNGKEKKGDLMMRFGISEAGATIFLGENEIRLNRRLNKTAPSQLLEFIIAFNNCSYGIKLNGKFLLSSNISDGEEEFFPQKWWEQLRFDQMTSFEVRK